DGLVIDSGYTNLMRPELNRSWLVSGTVAATRAENVIEASQAGSMCVGLVFLTDIPKSPGARPQLYDFVNLEAFPAGQYAFNSVGDVGRTIRKFTTKLLTAFDLKIEEIEKKKTITK